MTDHDDMDVEILERFRMLSLPQQLKVMQLLHEWQAQYAYDAKRADLHPRRPH